MVGERRPDEHGDRAAVGHDPDAEQGSDLEPDPESGSGSGVDARLAAVTGPPPEGATDV